MERIIGWDIGGVHLKGACAEGCRIVAATQVVSHIGYGLERVSDAFAAAKAALGPAARHAITMTGELADVFASRAEGVSTLARIATQALAPAPVSVYAGRCGFVAAGDVGHYVTAIASANWHASGTVAARQRRHALLVDVGSTTTDLVPLADGRIAARGYTDAERLAAGELVYTGLIRSHLLAVARAAPQNGVMAPLMNEIFADMGDVYRLLGRLDPAIDQQDTADGGDKSLAASWLRMARNVAREGDDLTAAARRNLARWFAEQQLRGIHDAAMLVLSAVELPEDAPLVAAGIGLDVVHELGRRMGRPVVTFDALIDLADAISGSAAHLAPAAAVALLAATPQAD